MTDRTKVKESIFETFQSRGNWHGLEVVVIWVKSGGGGIKGSRELFLNERAVVFDEALGHCLSGFLKRCLVYI